MTNDQDMSFNNEIGKFTVAYLGSLKQTLRVIRDMCITRQEDDPFQTIDNAFKPQDVEAEEFKRIVSEKIVEIKAGKEFKATLLLEVLIFLDDFIISSLGKFDIRSNRARLDNSLLKELEDFKKTRENQKFFDNEKLPFQHVQMSFNMNGFKLRDVFLFWKCIVKMYDRGNRTH